MTAFESGTAQTFFAIELPRRGRQPRTLELTLATVVSILGSLVLTALLVAVATHWFRISSRYAAFDMANYFVPTAVAVLAGCMAWPICTLFSARGRRVYLVVIIAAAAITIGLDAAWILQQEMAVILAVRIPVDVLVASAVYLPLTLLAPQWPRPVTPIQWYEPPRRD